jgi:LysM repeat protein
MPTPGTPPAPPIRSPTPEMISYIVREGDTLYEISLRYDVDMDTLIELNDLSDPNALSVGQEIKIPVEREPTATPSP